MLGLQVFNGTAPAGLCIVTELNLGDLDLPIFDEDLEKDSGAPEGALRLKRMMFEHHGFLIACPE